MNKVILIGLGSGLGGLMRFALAGWVHRLCSTTFPAGTLCVNAFGCLIIGALTASFNGPALIRQEYRLALTVGVLGGFTTFSSFGYETFSLINDRQYGAAAANLLLTNALGLAAVWLGYRLVELWIGGAS